MKGIFITLTVMNRCRLKVDIDIVLFAQFYLNWQNLREKRGKNQYKNEVYVRPKTVNFVGVSIYWPEFDFNKQTTYAV